MTFSARNRSITLTYGFFDEVVKIASASAEADWDRRMAPLQRKFEAGLDKIFSKQVPERIKAMLEEKFPGLKKPPVTKKIGVPLAGARYMTDKRLRSFAKKAGLFQDIVHHPLTQAIGYAALAGEGAHLLSEHPKAPRFLRQTARSKWGGRFGVGSVGLGSAFLAAEAASAVSDLLKKKRPGEAKIVQINLKLQPPDLPGQSSNTGPSGRDTALRLPRMSSGFRKALMQRRRR